MALVAAGFFALTPGGAGDQAAYAAETVADDGTRTVDFTKDWKFFLATGQGACRSYIWMQNVAEANQSADGSWSYRLIDMWVFNNLVRFAER